MYIDPSGNNALSSAIVEIGAAMISASYEVSYVAYVALLASIFVMATVEIVGTACGMSPDEIRTLAFEFVKQIGIFAFLTALTILAVYSPILAALSLAIGCTFLTIGTFELYVSLKEGDYESAALMGILLILGLKGVVGEVNALKAGEASIKSGGKIAVKAGYCDTGVDTENYVYRALNKKDYERLSKGLGLEARNPDGTWTLKQHIVNGSGKNPKAWENDPYISTTLDYSVAEGFNSGYGIVKIDLSKVPNECLKGFEIFPRVYGEEGLAYFYSVWQQEVSIRKSIPLEAIVEYMK